jgi:hypothetical protein
MVAKSIAEAEFAPWRRNEEEELKIGDQVVVEIFATTVRSRAKCSNFSPPRSGTISDSLRRRINEV